jgi:hypothetical protein
MQRKIAILIAAASLASAQDNPAGRAPRQWRQQHERAIVDEFVTLLAIPNIARDRENSRSTRKSGPIRPSSWCSAIGPYRMAAR